MDLLFQREQTPAGMLSVKFKLWGRVELDEDEHEMMERYQFDGAILIAADQPTLFRNSFLFGLFVMAVVIFALFRLDALGQFALIAIFAGAAAGFWFYNEKRETIYVRDLIHGRHFSCDSVVDLARKEAWLETVVAYLRQVMESAKHWDGTQRYRIQALPKEEARQVILKGL